MLTRKNASLAFITPLLLSIFTTSLDAKDYIIPPMVTIPAGTFMMGAEGGDPAISPMHSVAVDAFQMSKYTVTVAEFRKFAEDTGFTRDATCNDSIDRDGLRGPTHQGSGRWDNHRSSYSDYQPVVCISREDANAYAAWLSDKTGHSYRLPTEVEWEYAAKANTSTRFFWGNDPTLTQACKYGNFADFTGEYTNNTRYGLSNIGFVGMVNCDDGEAYNAIVGLYRPNPFGLYDMSGNVAEYLNACYDPNGYSINTKLTDENCEYTAHRGGTWHYPAAPTSTRGRFKKSGWNVDNNIGFRLVMDTDTVVSSPSTATFEIQLKQAQLKRLSQRARLIPAPDSVHLVSQSDGSFILNWTPVKDERISGYAIYRSTSTLAHLYGGDYREHYEKIKTVPAHQFSAQVVLPSEGGSLRVVALSNNGSSLPSPKAIAISAQEVVTVPGHFDMRHAAELDNVFMYYFPKTDTKPEAYNVFKTNKNFDQTEVSIRFNAYIAKSGWYYLNYSGRSFEQGEFFKLWQGNRLAGIVEFNSEIDDKKSERHKVYLDEGEHTLEITVLRTKFDRWGLGWLKFTESPLERP
ncbi:SUMF1/EgtB/PvdO family nonheme iron enzyme [Pseudoalteromonas sp. YIC-656]|uniref:SUMF1/EgtB/PvdO family nonheme iron enzyme n=1 Tax=Pseudoalteromonas pernae TaxID=3118054 RepID=UPI003241D007